MKKVSHKKRTPANGSFYKIQFFAQAQNSRLGNANASVRASLALRIFSVASRAKKRISTFIEIPKIQFLRKRKILSSEMRTQAFALRRTMGYAHFPH